MDLVSENIKKDPTDGNLLCKIAMTLYVCRMCRKENDKRNLTRKSIELFERSINFLGTEDDDSLRCMVRLYNELGEYDKAKEYLARIRGEKSWLHIELLRGQEKYDEAQKALKSYLLSEIVDVATKLELLADLFYESGDLEAGSLAEEKKKYMIQAFGLWNGIFEFEPSYNKFPKQISECILFDGVKAEKDGPYENETAMIFQELLEFYDKCFKREVQA